DMRDEFGAVDPSEIIVSGNSGRHRSNAVDHTRCTNTVDCGPEPVRPFGVIRASHMVGTSFIGHDEEHAAERSPHKVGLAGRIVATTWPCNP
ncbi:MAG: hypothetical protein ACI9C1_001965, partial [Candidatus Aldehydirespiratoraceae bacterium]